MRLYIAGPMTGYPDYNFPAFNYAADALRKRGYEVLNPADNGTTDGYEWADYLRDALEMVLKAQGIAVLPGHEMSRGARLETHVAFALGMPIKPWETWYYQPGPMGVR